MSATPHRESASDLTLVIGATGKTGRRVAALLKARGVATRAVSRSTEIPFDWHDRATWDAALAGVRHAYVSFAPDLAAPGTAPIITAFATRAREQGIERLVLLSGRGEEGAQECEQIVLGIDPRWTVVRAGWFNQNFSESFFQPGIRAGHLALPAGDVLEPFVDVDDLAEVAVEALTNPGHEGEIYEITGPRLLSFRDVVAEIAKATGRSLTYETIPTADYVAAATAQGAPAEIADLLIFLFDTVLDGRNAYLADGVQRALGRAPRDFGEFARTTAATGVWDEPTVENVPPSPTAVVRELVEAVFNRGDMARIPELVHENYVYRSPGEVIEGPRGLAALVRGYRSAFPDLHVQIDDLVETADGTLLCCTMTGTHHGDLLGIPATGRSMRVHGMVRSTLIDGRIQEEWEILDMLSLFEQLGIAGAVA